MISFVNSWVSGNYHVAKANPTYVGTVPSQLSTLPKLALPKIKMVAIQDCGWRKYVRNGYEYEFQRALPDATCREKTILAQIALYESGWRPAVKNSKSAAYGLLQYMPHGTWIPHGCNRFGSISSVHAQLRCGLQDIRRGLIKQWAVWPRIK